MTPPASPSQGHHLFGCPLRTPSGILLGSAIGWTSVCVLVVAVVILGTHDPEWGVA